MKFQEFKNWKNFFEIELENSKFYVKIDLGQHGDTIQERYVATDKNDKTSILIGYLDENLIYWKFENPLTVGFSEQQDREYFYRYDFTPEKSYGDPGLEFTENNFKAINSQLKYGLKGVEIQYFRDGKLIKSKLILDEPLEYSTIINFEKRSFWKRLFKNEKESLTEKRIELSKIFNGLENKNVR